MRRCAAETALLFCVSRPALARMALACMALVRPALARPIAPVRRGDDDDARVEERREQPPHDHRVGDVDDLPRKEPLGPRRALATRL